MATENEQNDLFMDFEEFIEEDGEDDGSDENGEEGRHGSEDDGSWEDVSIGGEDDGEIGEVEVDDQGDADVPAAEVDRLAAAAVPAPRVPQPYLHEPLPRDEDAMNDGDAPLHNVNPDRLGNNIWCLCGGQCHVEPTFTAGDCICCREIPEVADEADTQGSSCLTITNAFEAAILNPVSLYIGWMEYTERWRQAAKAFGQRNNEKYRYVAYRKVVRWCWGFLGKDIRVQLPACVHSRIIRAYPDRAGTYKGTVLRVLRR